MQYSGFALLANHSPQLGKRHAAHHNHIVARKGRTGVKPHRRQLGRIADKNDLASGSCPDKRDQVFKKITGTESRA